MKSVKNLIYESITKIASARLVDIYYGTSEYLTAAKIKMIVTTARRYFGDVLFASLGRFLEHRHHANEIAN